MQIIDSASEATAIMKGTPSRMRKETWNDAVRRLLQLGKSMPSSAIDALDDALPQFDAPVADGISSGYVSRVPSRQEIPVSPTTSASGAGAEQLPRWSSDHAEQGGITELYNKFNSLMAQFSELKKGQLQIAESLAMFVKATGERFPDSESDETDEDDEEVEKSKIGKALRGEGLAHGTIKEVLTLLASSRHSPNPPDFAMTALRKASSQEIDFDSLTSEQLIKFQSAKQMLGAAANGANINHGLLDQAARIVANPSGEASIVDMAAAAGRAGL